ncbi:MAG: HAD-IC family P-type ATPase [Oscillospiraceae bacterium]|nr:HAD-IC family P-type ATPase [Oscillospiraceae bacterium]
MLIAVGSYDNLLFCGVAFFTSLMGAAQEIRAKITLDRLRIVTQQNVTVIRAGIKRAIPACQIVRDDILLIKSGDQICCDAKVISSSGLQLDESLLTGEADARDKQSGDTVLSGSFVVAGSGSVVVQKVGGENYSYALAKEAAKEKRQKSRLTAAIKKIIKILTVIIIPVGILLFVSELFRQPGLPDNTPGSPIAEAVIPTVAALVGMIPQGLILLTGAAFAASVVTLSKKKVLVQSLSCVEALARVDVLCLDKTGTLTDGNPIVTGIIPLSDGLSDIEGIIGTTVHSIGDDNPTATALKEYFRQDNSWRVRTTARFSSYRKWSGAEFYEQGAYVIGAPEFITNDMTILTKAQSLSESGMRVLLFAKAKGLTSGSILSESRGIALVTLKEQLRKNAAETVRYFASQDVAVKIISGDNPAAASFIGQEAGIKDADRYIDMSRESNLSYRTICRLYTVFGRTTPHQKRELVAAMRQNGQTVAMTGDGVNDVLALKDADCGVAMASGNHAARNAADLVLLESDFAAMIPAVREGRRVINNIELVASLFLTKTMFSAVLAILFIILPFTYPFSPKHLTLLGSLTIGIPSFFLALRHDHRPVQGDFLKKVLSNAIPAALTVTASVMLIQLLSYLIQLDFRQSSTLCVLLTGSVQFMLLTKISMPLTLLRKILLAFLFSAFAASFILFAGFFEFAPVISNLALIYIPMISACATAVAGMGMIFPILHS